MKKFIFLVVMLVVFKNMICNFDVQNISKPEKYVIGCVRAGFFSSFTGVLNHLLWCDENNKTPLVYWNKDSLYYDTELKNQNVWEYYFEPVSSLTYEQTDEIHSNFFVNNYYADKCLFYPNLDRETRIKGYNIISKYVKVKKNIMEKIEIFYKEHIQGKKTIGIHLRGTDKYEEEKPVSVKIIAEEANKYSDCQFLIATDEERLLREAQLLINGKIIYYDSYKSPDGAPVHGSRKPSNVQLGEEVLIEALLLSRCDNFFHTRSNVSSAVLYFNPYMHHHLFV
jgi:hypothetical protein